MVSILLMHASASSPPMTADAILEVKVTLSWRSSVLNEPARSFCVSARDSMTFSILVSSSRTRSILPLMSLFKFFSSCVQMLSHVALTDSVSSFSSFALAFASLSPVDSRKRRPMPPARPIAAATQPTGPAAISRPDSVRIAAATVPPPPRRRLVQPTILLASIRAGVRNVLCTESMET